ncbi:hypothetical protein [Nocardioides bruguierae]|uniref:hypothetical protein n=1 Tax=Nocardioides bruguierae TaxID=2945102 RepID=UPI0020222774|nr:hypothetical protein [Nocardioides bruguierae]MCL8024411.1 hypothetical protein [Nocardioides bruguierae]
MTVHSALPVVHTLDAAVGAALDTVPAPGLALLLGLALAASPVLLLVPLLSMARPALSPAVPQPPVVERPVVERRVAEPAVAEGPGVPEDEASQRAADRWAEEVAIEIAVARLVAEAEMILRGAAVPDERRDDGGHFA